MQIDYIKRSTDEIPERWRNVDVTSMSDSEIEETVEGIYKTNLSIRLPIPFLPETVAEFFKMFHCQQCGECCLGQEGVFLLPWDVERLSTAMQMSKRQFKDKFTFVREGRRFLRGPCPFYDSNSHSCIVYQSRPRVCRLFPLFQLVTFQYNDVIVPKRFYSSTNGVSTMGISTQCPVARRIVCQFMKKKRDALILLQKERTK